MKVGRVTLGVLLVLVPPAPAVFAVVWPPSVVLVAADPGPATLTALTGPEPATAELAVLDPGVTAPDCSAVGVRNWKASGAAAVVPVL